MATPTSVVKKKSKKNRLFLGRHHQAFSLNALTFTCENFKKFHFLLSPTPGIHYALSKTVSTFSYTFVLLKLKLLWGAANLGCELKLFDHHENFKERV